MGANPPVREWIDAVCRRSSRVTGWPIVFESAGRQANGSIPTDFCGPSQWRSSVSNGTETVGTLRLEPLQGRKRDEGYLHACEVAELTAHLIERVLTEQASNELLRVSNRPAPAQPSSTGVSVTIERGLPQQQPLRYVQTLLRTAVRQSGFPAAALFIHEPGTDELRLRAQQAPEWLNIPQPTRLLSLSPVDAACLKGELQVLQRSMLSDDEASLLPDQIAVGVCRAITAAGRPLGTLWLYDRRERRLTIREQHIIASVTSRLGELIERTRLLDESERSQRLRIELQVAARSQPAAQVQYEGTDAWYELAGHSESSDEVGGDLLEVIPLPEDRVFVAVGDAAGHSIPAAMLMASVRGALRSLFDPSTFNSDCTPIPPPHEVLRRVNFVLHGIANANQFMTMFCAILDGRRMQIEYASAGHPPVLLMRSGDAEKLDERGLVLGVLDDTSYESTIISLQPGDLLALYTDGVSEAIDDSRQMFGVEGISAIASQYQKEKVAAILEHVWSGLQQHLSEKSAPDDRTLALLRINSSITQSPSPKKEEPETYC